MFKPCTETWQRIGLSLPGMLKQAITHMRRLTREVDCRSGARNGAKARECEERPEQTRNSFIKQELLAIAQRCRHMADHAEKYSR
jgi:hypothetical protein